MNLKNIKNFKKGVKELSIEQQLNVTKVSSFWGMVGLVISFIAMVILQIITINWSSPINIIKSIEWKTFGFTIFVFFIIPLQFMQYKGSKDKLKQIKEGNDAYNNLIKNMDGGENV